MVEASPTLILTRLINGLAAWKRDLVLAIDDAHFLIDPEAGAILDVLLAYAPPNMRVLLATRGAVRSRWGRFGCAARWSGSTRARCA